MPYRALLSLLLLAAGAGCAGGRMAGDPDAPTRVITVDLERAFVRAISRERIVVGVGPGAEHGREASFGFGHGVWTTSTEVDLLGGSAPGGSDLLFAPLSWGANRIEVPLRHGRRLHLSLRVSGDRIGTHRFAPVTVGDAPIRVDATATAVPPDAEEP